MVKLQNIEEQWFECVWTLFGAPKTMQESKLFSLEPMLLSCIPKDPLLFNNHISYFLSRLLLKREKSGLHPSTIAKVWFSTTTTKPDNIDHPTIKTGQIWPPGIVFKGVFHFVRIKNIQFYNKKFISNSFEVKKFWNGYQNFSKNVTYLLSHDLWATRI